MTLLALTKEDVMESDAVAVEGRAMFEMLDVASVAMEMAVVAFCEWLGSYIACE